MALAAPCECALLGLAVLCDALGVEMHENQLAISDSMVRELLNEQFPHWRDLSLQRLKGSGTVHAIFRLGDGLAVRLRLEAETAESVLADLHAEAQASREIIGRTGIATPEIVETGSPGRGYPLPWSVQTWIPGVVALANDPGESDGFAADLAEFISGVRNIDTRGRIYNGNGRGGDLASHDEWVQECLINSEGLMDVAALSATWDRLRDLPRGDSPDVMNHGDLIPGNVLVTDQKRLAGVLDVGGLAAADPALDLVAAWHLLNTGPRTVLRRHLDVADDEWERGKGWAFEQAVGGVWYYVDSNPEFSQFCRRTLERIMAA